MTAFGWKRKAGEKIDKHLFGKSVFNTDENIDDSSNWIHSSKRKKIDSASNSKSLFDEFKGKGVQLAELGMYSKAVEQWDQALQIMPSDPKLLEMKAQALLQMNCLTPALQAARRAVMSDPLWWVAYQTLGRVQLHLGDIHMAIFSFSKAIHINPECTELWEDDLGWAVELSNKEKQLKLESIDKEIGKD